MFRFYRQLQKMNQLRIHTYRCKFGYTQWFVS